MVFLVFFFFEAGLISSCVNERRKYNDTSPVLRFSAAILTNLLFCFDCERENEPGTQTKNPGATLEH